MSDAIQIQRGQQPWLPAVDADLVEVFRRYDAPLEGIVLQHGVPFLFRCLVGEVEQFSVWAYASLDSTERGRLSSADPDAIDSREAEAWRSQRPIAVAVATEEYGILEAIELDGPLTRDKLVGLKHLLSDALDRRIAEVRSELESAAASLQTLAL